MSKKLYLRRIRARRSYSTSELSDLLTVHVRTVQRWHREGMAAIDEHDRPFLFMGAEVSRFLNNQKNRRKCRLADDEFYCPRCRSARKSDCRSISVDITEKRIGRRDRLVLIRGICSECGCRLTRFGTKTGVETSIWRYAIRQADPGLKGNSDACLNGDLEGGSQ